MGKNLEEVDPLDWRSRYRQQAGWTRSLRDYIYAASRIEQAQRVLEVGCGPGAILEDLPQHSPASIFGVDLDRQALELAHTHIPQAALIQGDGLCLPFASASFDHCLCHFFLLWVKDPALAVKEMKRVTRRGGYILVLAEPDYGARIDYPSELSVLGEWQQSALRDQGADPQMGRKIQGLLHTAGLSSIQSGVIGGQWSSRPAPEEWQSEWAVIRSDLKGLPAAHELDEYQKKDAAAWDRGERILFVPTFYTWGTVR